jgi:putative tricarboxylic transport membrane protein
VRRADTIAAICVALLGATTIALARQLPYQAEYGPGAGFLPLWLGVTLVFLSFFLLRDALREENTGTTPRLAGDAAGFFSFGPGAMVPWLIFFVSTIALALLFERLGFGLSIGLYMVVTMRWVAQRSWLATVALAVATPLVLYLGFVRILMVPLPLAPPGL